jgi:hypothetical protein
MVPEEDEPPEEGMLEGIDDLDPLRPEGEGMLGEPPPPPELPAEPLDEDEPPAEPPEDGEDGEGMEVDWLAQPPIRNADTVLTAVACTATTSSRFHG